MKERPILFSGEMVRAERAGIKTQTRRTRKLELINKCPHLWRYLGTSSPLMHEFTNVETELSISIKCPFGEVGDRLWGRETAQYSEYGGLWRWGTNAEAKVEFEFPRISLIIPARGDEVMLIKTVNSALERANHFPIEIIIVDNGLNPEIEITGDGPIRIVKYQDVRGPAAARHAGITHAKGDVIVTIDSHVLLCKNWAFETFRAMQNYGLHDAIFCGHVGHLNDDFTPADEPCYHGAHFSWVDQKSSDFRPLAAMWHCGAKTIGERGAIMGAYYAFSKKCYEEICSPWRLIAGWGCDEEIISLAAVCEGKKIMMLPRSCCSWHWFGSARINYSEADILSLFKSRLSLVSLFPFSPEARKELSAVALETEAQKAFAAFHSLSYLRLDQHMLKWCKGYAEFLKRQDNAIEIDEKYLIPSI